MRLHSEAANEFGLLKTNLFTKAKLSSATAVQAAQAIVLKVQPYLEYYLNKPRTWWIPKLKTVRRLAALFSFDTSLNAYVYLKRRII